MAWSSSVKIVGLDSFKKGLSELELNQYPFAMSNALNGVATAVLFADKAQMQKDIDKPTPYTLNALKIGYAKKTNLESSVKFKEPPTLSQSQFYMSPQVFSGMRGFKNHEAALFGAGLLPAGYVTVPGKKVVLNAYGNVPQGTINEILKWFNAHPKQKADTQNSIKTKLRKGKRKTYGYEYDVVQKRVGRLLPGIYKRTFTPFGVSLEPILIFILRSKINYKHRYKFYETSKKEFNDNFKKQFDFNLQQALRTAFN